MIFISIIYKLYIDIIIRYKYLEPKLPLFWLEKTFDLGGKTRGPIWVPGILYIHTISDPIPQPTSPTCLQPKRPTGRWCHHLSQLQGSSFGTGGDRCSDLFFLDHHGYYPRNRTHRTHRTDPEKTWVSNSSIATDLGVRWDLVPFNFSWILLSLKLTANATWKMMLGRLSRFLLGPVLFSEANC